MLKILMNMSLKRWFREDPIILLRFNMLFIVYKFNVCRLAGFTTEMGQCAFVNQMTSTESDISIPQQCFLKHKPMVGSYSLRYRKCLSYMSLI